MSQDSGLRMILGFWVKFRKAVSNKDDEKINELLENAETITYPQGFLLHWAARSNLVYLIEALIKYGADVNVLNNNNETPLHFAAESGCLDALNKLIEYGANVNALYNNRATALHFAAKNGYTDVVKVLITQGADVNAQDFHDRTPLFWAAKNGLTHVAKELIDSGANQDLLSETDKRTLKVLLASEPVPQAESHQVDALQESVEHATEATTTDETISVIGDATLDA